MINHEVRLNCGHVMSRMDLKISLGKCAHCISIESEYTVMEYPYEYKGTELRAVAEHFKKHGNETLREYATRTFEARKEICRKQGKKIGSLESTNQNLSAVG